MRNDLEFESTLDNGMKVTVHCEVEENRIYDLYAVDEAGDEVALSKSEQERMYKRAYEEEIPNMLGGMSLASPRKTNIIVAG